MSLWRILRSTTCLWCLGLTGFAAVQPARGGKVDYNTVLTQARQYAAEGSWALAKESFASARAAAPDAEARRWSELGFADASWRSADSEEMGYHPPDWIDRQSAALDALLAPYDGVAAHDAFWLAVKESRAALHARAFGSASAWSDRFDALDYLADQPPGAAAADALIDYLQTLLRNRDQVYDDNTRARLDKFLLIARQTAPAGDKRAWIFVRSAELGNRNRFLPLPARAELWAQALAASAGTTFQPEALAGEYLFRINTGWSPDSPKDTVVSAAARLDELAALRAKLRGANPTLLPTQFPSRLDEFEKLWRQPQLGIAMERSFTTTAIPRFRYSAAGYRELTVEIYRHTLESWTKRPDDVAELVREGVSPDFPARSNRLEALRAVAERVDRFTIPLAGAETRSWQSEVRDLPVRAPGFYTVALIGDGPAGQKAFLHHFIISDARIAIATSPAVPGTAFFHAADSYAPLANRAVRGIVRPDGAPALTFAATTDQSGAVQLPTIGTGQEFIHSVLSATIDGHPIEYDFGVPENFSPQVTADLILDRPLYRPGETVHWKIVARERDSGRFIPPKQKLTVSVRMASSSVPLVTDQAITFNAWGTARGEWTIPAATRPDHAVVVLQLEGKNEVQLPATFRVDNFIPPALKADIAATGGADAMRPGQELVFQVQADYLSGGSAGGIPVLCDFKVHSYADLSRDIILRNSFETWQRALDQGSQRATTDRNGRAEFRIRIPDLIPPDASLSVSATVEPPGMQTVQTRTSVRITPTGLTVLTDGWTEPHPARPGETVDFACSLFDGEQKPQQVETEAQLVEKKWLETWLSPDGRLVSGSELAWVRAELKSPPDRPLPAPWRQLYADYVETLVSSVHCQSDAKGNVQVPFRIPHAGFFQLHFQHGGKALSPSGNELSVIAADEATTDLAVSPSYSNVLVPSSVDSSGSVPALVILPEGRSSGVIAVSGENDTVVRRFDLAGRVGWLSVDRPPRLAGGGRVVVQPFGGKISNAAFKITDPSVRLNVTLQTTGEEAKPGASAAATISVTDQAGQPVPAEITAFASDEAVNRLVPEAYRSFNPVFWNFYEAIPVAITGSALAGFNERPLEPLPDIRPGMRLNPSTPLADFDDEMVELIPFEVSAGEGGVGYAAMNTLAGTRLTLSIPQSRGLAAMPQDALPAQPALVVRQHFSSTAFWEPDVVTDESGQARIAFTYPDNLTGWRFTAYAVGRDGNRFGEALAFTRTTLPFQARLQTPRFLVAGDTASFSATLVNRREQSLSASAQLTASGAVETLAAGSAPRENLALAPLAETSASWSVHAKQAGDATLELQAAAGTDADAMQLVVPVLENGMIQDTAASGRIAPDRKDLALTLALPSPLDPARTQVRVLVSPSHAVTLLDALPDLIDYPYGCVEQTMSRFLPAILAKNALRELGFNAADIEHRILSRPPVADGWRRPTGAGFGKLDEVVEQSLSRLAASQISRSGGYGWWPGQTESDPWMTAYVGWGLALAADAGVAVPPQLFPTRALLQVRRTLEPSDDQLAWTVAALARLVSHLPASERDEAMDVSRSHFEEAFDARDRLSASGRANLASAARAFGTAEQRAILVRNLENGAERSRSNDLGDTVHWGRTAGYWRATEGAVESTALTLLALLENDPHHPLIEPAVNWLVLNRRSAGWQNTRETAFAVLALTQVLVARGETAPNADVELRVNGRSVQRISLTRQTLRDGAVSLVLDPANLRPGKNNLELRRVSGKSSVYATALASSWAKGDTVKPASHLVGVSRDFTRLKPQPTLAGTLRIARQPLPPGGTAATGEQVNARITLTVPNELEYVMVAAPKPAGCEPLNPLSGWDATLRRMNPTPEARAADGDSTDTPDYSVTERRIYREEHDTQTVFFLDHLAAGTWEIVFPLRAITPGNFQTLPVEVEAMYAPDIHANSDARRLTIEPADLSSAP